MQRARPSATHNAKYFFHMWRTTVDKMVQLSKRMSGFLIPWNASNSQEGPARDSLSHTTLYMLHRES